MPKHKSHAKEPRRLSSSSSPAATGAEYEYPGLWCEWEWEGDEKRWRRYRLKSPSKENLDGQKLYSLHIA